MLVALLCSLLTFSKLDYIVKRGGASSPVFFIVSLVQVSTRPGTEMAAVAGTGAGAGADAVAMDLRSLRAALAADLPLFAVEGSHLPGTIVFPYEDRDSAQSLQARRLVSLLERAVFYDDC